jgi:hypothetical protein
MLKLNWIAGAALISLGSLAFAQQQQPSAREAVVDGSTGARQPFTSTMSRADVKAELERARASGELDGWREQTVEGTSMIAANVAAGAQGRAFAKPGLTREQVKAELDRARANGEIAYAPEHGGRH